MPLAKIHVVEGRYDEARIAKVSGAIQAALMNTLRVPHRARYERSDGYRYYSAQRSSRREKLFYLMSDNAH